ncbi:MAG: glycosyltransferase family 2 protein [Fusobacteriaceae bacterium]|jgi:glycosyltransferase involved in cell wall biosynthesis|nr:glycosyltransferase family 2 protein [Fusobacteriaceae bacterium]
MNNNSLISCIVTSFNSEYTIIETLISIKNQTYPNWECVIADDGSRDNTVAVVRKFIENDNRFKLIVNEQNSGKQAKMLNQGIFNSKGEYLLFIDSDDIISVDCLMNRVHHFDENFDFVVFPNTKRFISNINEDVNIPYLYNHRKANYLKDFIIHTYPTPWQITCILWKRISIEALSGFNERYNRMVDVELSTRALIYDLKYEVKLGQIDFYYRTTINEFDIKNKRENFFISSMIYIEEIKKFTLNNAPNKWLIVRKYLYCFFFSILRMTITTKQFSAKDSIELINCAKNNGLISLQNTKLLKIFFCKKLIHKITKLPIIRSIIFRIIGLYIKCA